MKEEKREKFASRLGFILVSAGCAVGLGNVWKFPYICGMNGGAFFILIYLCCLIVLGLPILICEFSVGRGSGMSIGRAFHKLEPEGTRWHRYRWFGFAGNYLLMMFYTMVAGWMIYYVYVMGSGVIRHAPVKGIDEYFKHMQRSPGTMIFWTLVVVALCIGICCLGLQKGVEKITKVMMLALMALMVVMAVNSLVLKGSGKGLAFYLIPDWSRVQERGLGNVIFDAMTHSFFTLSVGIGAMEIFGSYLGKERKLTGEAVSVLVLDTVIALVAGIIIIPACISFGIAPDAGPSLLFITLPNVFNQMAGGRIWGMLFFVFMSFAALSTVIAVFENIISISMDLFGWERKKALGVNLAGIAALSMPAVLGFNLWSGVQLLGQGSTIMDVEDFLVSYNILPLGSLLFVLFCVKKNGWGFDAFLQETNTGIGSSFPRGLKYYMLYVLPAIILVIYFKGYYDMFKNREPLVCGIWMAVAVLFAGLGLYLAAGGEKGIRQ